jgi:putative transposase
VSLDNDRMALADLIQKTGDGDFLRTLAESVLQILMEADVEGVIGAGRWSWCCPGLVDSSGFFSVG